MAKLEINHKNKNKTQKIRSPYFWEKTGISLSP